MPWRLRSAHGSPPWLSGVMWSTSSEGRWSQTLQIAGLPCASDSNRTPATNSIALRRGGLVAVVKIIELVGSSKKSSDDAAQQALKQAQGSLRNIRAVDVVSTGLRGENLDEWRAHVRVAFLVEGSDVD
jgi:dodecin